MKQNQKQKTKKGTNYFRNTVVEHKQGKGGVKFVPVQQKDSGTQKGKALRDYENEWDGFLLQEKKDRNRKKIKIDEIKNGLADRALSRFGAVVPENNSSLNLISDEILSENSDQKDEEDYDHSGSYEEILPLMIGDTDYEKFLRTLLKSINSELSLLPPESTNEPKDVMNKRFTLEEHRDETLSKLRSLNGDGITEPMLGVPTRSASDRRRAHEATLDPAYKDDDDDNDYEPTRVVRSK